MCMWPNKRHGVTWFTRRAENTLHSPSMANLNITKLVLRAQIGCSSFSVSVTTRSCPGLTRTAGRTFRLWSSSPFKQQMPTCLEPEIKLPHTVDKCWTQECRQKVGRVLRGVAALRQIDLGNAKRASVCSARGAPRAKPIP